MNANIRFLALAVVSAAAGPHWAQAQVDCSAVVETTIAELSAGYPDWDSRVEALARTAAGSACVKAAVTPAVAADRDAGLNTESVAATGAGAAASAAPAGGTAAAGAASSAEEDAEGWHPFKDIKFNEVSARPGKKPYERRRDPVDD